MGEGNHIIAETRFSERVGARSRVELELQVHTLYCSICSTLDISVEKGNK